MEIDSSDFRCDACFDRDCSTQKREAHGGWWVVGVVVGGLASGALAANAYYYHPYYYGYYPADG